MDPSSGRLFGAVGSADSSETTPAAGSAAADAVILSWYTLQWLKSQRSGEAEAAAPMAANEPPSGR